VGIRGTGGLIEVLPDLSTLIKGTSGIWVLTNPAGQLDVPAGTQGIATPNLKEPPKQTSQLPQLPPAPLSILASFSADEVTTAIGEACVVIQNCSAVTPVAPPMASGPGYQVSFAYGFGGASPTTAIGSALAPANATFNATGQLTTWTDARGTTVSLLGTQAESGNVPGVVAWGRWTGTVMIGGATPTFGTDEGFHYVAGLPTPSMPTTGIAVPYSMIGSTKAIGSDGLVGLGTASVSLNANFLAGTASVGVITSFGTWGYNATIPGTISGSLMTGSAGSTLFGTGTPPVNYACGSGCTASFDGAFYGAGASHAGLVYQIGPTSTSTAVTGAAVLQK